MTATALQIGEKAPEFALSSTTGDKIGSALHVMLALRRRFCQVVVADKIFDGANVVGQLFGKRQRTAHQS
jgi:hypothetical protein